MFETTRVLESAERAASPSSASLGGSLCVVCKCRLSAALPVVRHLFEDCRLCKAAAPSVSAETLRATASAAVFSASRLSAAFPLVGRVNATAFLGLLAAGKGIHEVLAAAPLLATLFPESASTQRVGDSQPLCAFPLSPVRIQGPSDAENPETALEEETAPLMLRAQTLLRWLTAASEVGTPSADGGLRTTRLVNAARRELLPLLQEVARRQLEWRDKKRAAEDATKTLLERLEDLVEDRAAEESARKKGRSASALEKERNEEVAALFPSEEWGEASEDFSKSQEETSGPVPTSQYDAWLSGSTANDGNDAESESLSEVESNMGEATFAGFSEEDLSAFWNSVLRAFTSRQDRLSETAETSVECYRDAFSVSRETRTEPMFSTTHLSPSPTCERFEWLMSRRQRSVSCCPPPNPKSLKGLSCFLSERRKRGFFSLIFSTTPAGRTWRRC